MEGERSPAPVREAEKRSRDIAESFGGKVDRKKDRAGLRALVGNFEPTAKKTNGTAALVPQQDGHADITELTTALPVTTVGNQLETTLPQLPSRASKRAPNGVIAIPQAVPQVIESVDSFIQDLINDETYEQPYLPEMTPPVRTEEPKKPPLPVRLPFFSPDANNQPDLRSFAEEFWDPKSLAEMEAIAHIESPRKNERSQIFLDREQRKKEQYLASHPDVSEEEYAQIRKRQLEQTKSRTRRRGITYLYNAIPENFPIGRELPDSFLDRHLGIGTKAIEEIYATVYPGEESPLRNANQLPSISPWHDMMAILSPNVDQKFKEQTKAIYLMAHESAKIEAANPKDAAGKKLSLIQALFDEELFEGMTGQTQDVSMRAIFSRGEHLLQGIEGLTPEISSTDLHSGQSVKEITLPMRTMQGTDILMYTNANVKGPTSGLSKAFKKAILRAGKPDGSDALDSTHDVTDTYRIKFAVMGGEQEVDTVMYKVLEILTDPDNKKALVGLNEYGEPIETNSEVPIIKKWEPDSDINRTPDQPDKEPVFRDRVQIYFADLHHPVEIMFQTMEEFLRGEYNVGHYSDKDGKYTGIAHDLYEIARAKLIAGVIFDKSVYTEPHHQDLEGSARKTMENKAQDLRKRHVVTIGSEQSL